MRGVDQQDAADMRTLRRKLVREDCARDFELECIFFPRWFILLGIGVGMQDAQHTFFLMVLILQSL